MTVEYREIPGWPGYRVGDDGSVWSRMKLGRPGGLGSVWRQRKPSKAKAYGHCYVVLSMDGVSATFLIHRLVLEAFVGPCPPGMECCHNNGNSSDNRLANLRWDTSKSNKADMVRHGTSARGELAPWSKLTESQVIEIRRLCDSGLVSQYQIANLYGVKRPLISKIALRKRWAWLGEVGAESIPQSVPSASQSMA